MALAFRHPSSSAFLTTASAQCLRLSELFFHFTLRAKLSGAVYCNRSCLSVCVCVCVFVSVFVGLFVCLLVCYHDNSKLRASIFTKLCLRVKVVTS